MKTIGPIETCGDCPFFRPDINIRDNLWTSPLCGHPKAVPDYQNFGQGNAPPTWCPLPDAPSIPACEPMPNNLSISGDRPA